LYKRGLNRGREHIELVQQAYESFARGDLPGLFALMAPEVEVSQSPELPWGGVYRGHAEVRRFLGKLTQHIQSRVEVERLIDAGGHVVAIGCTRGTVRATGVPFDVPVAHVWEVREGQLLRFHPYIDNGKMLAALRAQDLSLDAH
jgi:hypothetical protein